MRVQYHVLMSYIVWSWPMGSAISGLMVPWPIAWHIPMLGMPRVTPFLPPASSSAAVGVDVASYGDGDDDDDSDDDNGGDNDNIDDVAVVDEDGVSSASPLSSWSSPSDLAVFWRSASFIRLFLRSYGSLGFFLSEPGCCVVAASASSCSCVSRFYPSSCGFVSQSRFVSQLCCCHTQFRFCGFGCRLCRVD